MLPHCGHQDQCVFEETALAKSPFASAIWNDFRTATTRRQCLVVSIFFPESSRSHACSVNLGVAGLILSLVAEPVFWWLSQRPILHHAVFGQPVDSEPPFVVVVEERLTQASSH